jgi:hypothetical protein
MFTVSAAPDAAFDIGTLQVVGRAPGLTEAASKLLVFAQQGALPTNVLTQIGLPASLALAEPVAFETPATPVEIAHGYGGPVPIKVKRDKGAEGALALTLVSPVANQPPAPGIGGAGTIADKADAGAATINAAVEAPLGLLTLVLSAKGKIAGRDRTMSLPAVTVNVVRPASVEVATPAEIKAGTTVEVKGKVVRKGPFKEPVTVKLEGLPAGLKADPVTVAPDKAEFALKVVADAKAAAAATNARVALAFQVNKKDYPTPPLPLAVKVVAAK